MVNHTVCGPLKPQTQIHYFALSEMKFRVHIFHKLLFIFRCKIQQIVELWNIFEIFHVILHTIILLSSNARSIQVNMHIYFISVSANSESLYLGGLIRP